MADLKIKKLALLPTTFEANTVYFTRTTEGNLALSLSNNAGSDVVTLDQTDDILSQVMISSPTAPDIVTTKQLFWWNSERGTLFIRYTSDSSTAWVEANPIASIPQFAGSGGLWGVADTFARSDHTHDSIDIEANW